jgi:8-oxo-dGTP pyrophosphatase MutT (NUDIX family)
MAFGPAVHVFPGGRVDPLDAEPERLARAGLSAATAALSMGIGLEPDDDLSPTAALAHHLAAVRETAEETGIEIAAAHLVSMSRWVTPPSMARRFDARFFATFVPPGTDVLAGSGEVAEALWLTPAAALAATAAGRLDLWQPTFVTLQQLDGLADPAAIREAFAPGPARGGPVIERIRPDLARVSAVWAGGIPGRRAVGWLVGRHDVIVVDPADPTGQTSDAIIAELAATGARPVGVAVASLSPERHAGVEMFAHGLGLPVAAPSGLGAGAPYPLIELGATERPPFGDADLPLSRILRPT